MKLFTVPLFWGFVVLLYLFTLPNTAFAAAGNESKNLWAVILSSSRYFFNIRHTANALAMYHLCRKHGIDDDKIILFLSDSFACDPRNPYPAMIKSVMLNSSKLNLYGCSVEVDFAGYDVDVRQFLGVLQGRYDVNTPPSRRLQTDENSNIIIYAAGHAAPSFFKFQDMEFLGSQDIADTLMMMWEQRRYAKVVFLVDTCYALTMCLEIKAPNVVCLSSSDAETESFSHHVDELLGLTVISRWSLESLRLLHTAKCQVEPNERTALQVSLHEFNYGEERKNLLYTRSIPSHFDAVNDPHAIYNWTLEEFFCDRDVEITPVKLRYDLL